MPYRPYMNPNKGRTLVMIHWCKCRPEQRRGPKGGVCGCCGGAIPSDREQPAKEA